jgi:hypothetical protein
MSTTETLSEVALSLLQLRIERKGHIAVDNSTREPYRKLARAGLMIAGSTFRDGEQSIYCLTKAGYDLKIERLACAREEMCADVRPVAEPTSPSPLKVRL